MITKYKILTSYSIRDAVKHMDEAGNRFCVCVDEEDNVVGIITDGDFRSAIHNGIQLDESVKEIMNKEFYFLSSNYIEKEVETIFNNTIVRKIPILEDKKLVDIIPYDEFYSKDKNKKKQSINSPVVIMAGGKGTRLDPFTRILPKPLIPIGNEPIIKVIMDEFNSHGMSEFYISLKDKGRMIRAYFYEHNLGYQIKYLFENKPLGTAGAIKFLEGKFSDSFFVSNCDIIIKTNYEDFLNFHKDGKFALSMVGSVQQYTIPYGVCEVSNSGELRRIQEKPRYDFLVNTGLYILEPEILRLVPADVYFDMTDLIQKVKEHDFKVGVFPVSEKSWIDIGQWVDYEHFISDSNLDLHAKF